MPDEEKKEFAAFYTPEATAKMVVELANVDPEHKILEPSCGGGALVRALLAGGATNIRCYDIRKSCCSEVERLGTAVVATEADFLEVTPRRIYDRIVMNPPFTNGADVRHCAHAFKFLKQWGELVAIVPDRGGTKFTEALRGEGSFDADVQDLPDFTFREEGTDVRTCVLTVTRKDAEPEEQDYSRPRRPQVQTNLPMASISVPEIIADVNDIKKDLHTLDDMVLRLEEKYRALQQKGVSLPGLNCCSGFHPRYGHDEYYDSTRQRHANNAHELNVLAWLIAVTRTQVWSVMDAEEREKFQEALKSPKTCPPFSLEAVEPTLNRLRTESGKFFVRGILKVFKSLSWNHKTNSPVRFTEKMIQRYTVERSYSNTGCPHFRYTNSGRSDSLEDLHRALHLLDGKPEPDHASSLTRKANDFWRSIGKYADYEDEYLKIRPFKNGNVHVWVLKPELVQKMNEIMGEAMPFSLPETDKWG